MTRRFALALLTIGCCCGQAAGAVLSVPEDHPSLTAAVSAAETGDEIRLGPGVYSPTATRENFPIVLAGKSLLIQGADPWRCVLDAEGRDRLFVICKGDSSALRALTLTGGSADGAGGAVFAEAAAPVLAHLCFRANTATGGGDALALEDCRAAVNNCLFVGNDGRGPTVFIAGGQVRFESNTLDGNGGTALALEGRGGWELRHNICSRPGTPSGPAVGVLLGETVLPQDLRLDRNLFAFCREGALVSAVEDSAIDLGEIDWAGGPATPRVGDPLFRDSDDDDFRLRPESPARWVVPYVAANGAITPVARQLGAYGDPQPFALPPNALLGDPLAADALARGQGSAGLLEPPVPNPFNPATSIPFVMKRPSVVDLGIYNILGQRVRTLFAGDLPAGEHRETWDGRDDLQVDLPPGIYFVRITQGEVTESRRVVLVR